MSLRSSTKIVILPVKDLLDASALEYIAVSAILYQKRDHEHEHEHEYERERDHTPGLHETLQYTLRYTHNH